MEKKVKLPLVLSPTVTTVSTFLKVNSSPSWATQIELSTRVSMGK